MQTIEQRPCTLCRRLVPAGFLYCGYCAAPMENTDVRARVAEVAAPLGGWPKLAAELVEVRFFLQQGALDEAYEMLSILQRRYPGHPELADFARTGGNVRAADPQVEALVDGVLADSSTLGGQVLRRRSVKWGAPAAPGAPKKWTTAHEVVRAAIPVETALVDEPARVPPPVNRKPRVRHPAKSSTASGKTSGKTGAQPRPPAQPGSPRSGEPRPTAPMAAGAKKPAPRKDATRVYRAVIPKSPPRPGMTMAVEALQEPAPFGAAESHSKMTMAVSGLQTPSPFAPKPAEASAVSAAVQPAAEVAAAPKTKKKGKAGRGAKVATKTGRKRKLEARESKAPRTVAFGAGVLSRYGR